MHVISNIIGILRHAIFYYVDMYFIRSCPQSLVAGAEANVFVSFEQRPPVFCGCHDGFILGAVSIRKTVLPGMAIPMLKIRRPNGRLIFNMEITIRR